ncbi:MAG TPA: hypothetical protein VIJ68_00750 [Candidatus Saccharimonadales bacterium]
MKKNELEKHKLDQKVRVIFFVCGLSVAFVLALVNSTYTTAAFTFVGGLLGGSVLEKSV